MFEDNIDYITRVWDGSLQTSRHDSWNIGGGPRQRLMWRQSCHPFSDDQLNWTLECINTKFVGPDVNKRISMNNYFWKVVLPETLPKFYVNFLLQPWGCRDQDEDDASVIPGDFWKWGLSTIQMWLPGINMWLPVVSTWLLPTAVNIRLHVTSSYEHVTFRCKHSTSSY